MANLDVKGAFDATWWPAILKGLRVAKCSQNLYQHTQDYFREREEQKYQLTALKLIRILPKVSHKNLAVDSVFWNNQYNSLLNLRYINHTKTVAFADDLVIMIKADSIREA